MSADRPVESPIVPYYRRASLRRWTAWHEAGHAVTRVALGCGATAVEIHDDGTGLCHGTGLRHASRAELDAAIVHTLAGPLAEARVRRVAVDRVFASAGAEDVRQAIELISSMGPYDSAWWTHYVATSRDVVRRHWDAISRVGAALIECGRLDADSVRNLVEAIS